MGDTREQHVETPQQPVKQRKPALTKGSTNSLTHSNKGPRRWGWRPSLPGRAQGGAETPVPVIL